MRWGRILAMGLGLSGLAGASLLLSLWLLRPEPEPEPPPFPTRVATASEQRRILQPVFLSFFRGVPSPPPSPGDPPQLPLTSRPLVVATSTLRFCVEADVGPSSLGADCALPYVEEIIASPRWKLDLQDPPDLPLRFRQALIELNRTSSGQSIPTGRPTIPVSSVELHRQLSQGYWEAFYDRYPGSAGVVRTTLAILSKDGMQALLYVEHRCDGLCGSGNLVVMRRVNGQWRIETSYMLWIS